MEVASSVFGGLGAVLTFLPPIFFLFPELALLEDSGYLARAAFMMNRIMYKLGLHGRSFEKGSVKPCYSRVIRREYVKNV